MFLERNPDPSVTIRRRVGQKVPTLHSTRSASVSRASFARCQTVCLQKLPRDFPNDQSSPGTALYRRSSRSWFWHRDKAPPRSALVVRGFFPKHGTSLGILPNPLQSLAPGYYLLNLHEHNYTSNLNDFKACCGYVMSYDHQALWIYRHYVSLPPPPPF